jgi:RNA polymerase sigma factor (sigma-70 family)
VRAIDDSYEDSTVVKVIKLRNSDATEMVELVGNLFPENSQLENGGSVAQFGGGPPNFAPGPEFGGPPGNFGGATAARAKGLRGAVGVPHRRTHCDKKIVTLPCLAAFRCVQELDDVALLRQYTEQNSEEAFAALVARHIDKVYSVALRHVRNPHQAEEITQSVFVILAKKSRHLGKGVVVSGWLYQTARLTAITFIRSEIRRTRREQEAQMQTELNETESDIWPQIAPLLDAAMAVLSEKDRHAVVLRFFDDCSMSEVGAALNASEDAAKKRVSRAVEKLRLFFTKRGVILPAAVLQTAISANSVQAAPIGLAKAISVAAIAQGATANASIMLLVKGVLKPVFTSSAGTLVGLIPLLGSVFFHLKAEIENTKSPRERQFTVRMIWFRFSIALLFTAMPLFVGLMMPSLIKQRGVVEYGFAGYFFCGAVEAAARTVYFHRRRRQIQIEDGTFEEFDLGKPTDPAELLGDLKDKASKSNRYAAMAAVFGLATCILFGGGLIKQMLEGRHWIAALLFLLWFGFASFRWIRNWRQRPRFVFDSRFGRLAKIMVFCAVMSLLAFDLSWARGRLQPSLGWAIGFNILMILAYAALIKVFARAHRPLAAAPDSISISTQNCESR